MPKSKCQLQPTKWVLRIINLEGQTNCMIGSKVTRIFDAVEKRKKSKTYDDGMWGC